MLKATGFDSHTVLMTSWTVVVDVALQVIDVATLFF
jgi:hypothetical protein